MDLTRDVMSCGLCAKGPLMLKVDSGRCYELSMFSMSFSGYQMCLGDMFIQDNTRSKCLFHAIAANVNF